MKNTWACWRRSAVIRAKVWGGVSTLPAHGLELVTGLPAQPDTVPGWVGLTCGDEAMAFYLLHPLSNWLSAFSRYQGADREGVRAREQSRLSFPTFPINRYTGIILDSSLLTVLQDGVRSNQFCFGFLSMPKDSE